MYLQNIVYVIVHTHRYISHVTKRVLGMSMDGLGAEEQQRKDGLCKVRHEQEKSECGWTADRREWEKKHVVDKFLVPIKVL